MNRIRPTGNKGTCIADLFRPGLVTVISLGLSALVTLGATHDAGAAGGATALARHEPVALSPDAAIGARAFTDPSLSASGKQSCASCHAPETAHAAPNALPVQPGGADMTLQGLRNSQPLRYLATNKAFQVDASGKPSGGFFWDGRANSLAAQADQPLLGANEMANKDKASVVVKVAQAQWAAEFTALYGEGVLQDVDLAFAKLTHALERFQLEDVQFNAYTSKYDAVLRRQARLTAQEKRGLILFNAPRKGNCAACHPSSKQPDAAVPLLTAAVTARPRKIEGPAYALAGAPCEPLALKGLAHALNAAIGKQDVSITHLPLGWSGAYTHFRHPLDYLGFDGGGGVGAGPGLTVGAALAAEKNAVPRPVPKMNTRPVA